MISNRSVPPNTVLPHIFYADVAEAVSWLTGAFGFTEHYRYGDPGGPPSGAQMWLGNAWIMLRRARTGSASPAQLGYGTQSLTLFIADVGEHFQKAKSAGVRIIEDLHETEYGELQYGAVGLAGHHWLFSRHARDVNPVDWGAAVSEPAIMAPQISPMLAVADAVAAIDFYKTAFDATVLWRLGGSEHMVAGLSGARRSAFPIHRIARIWNPRPGGSRFHNRQDRTLRERPRCGPQASSRRGSRRAQPRCRAPVLHDRTAAHQKDAPGSLGRSLRAHVAGRKGS